MFLCEGSLQLRRAGPLFMAVRGPLTVAASPVAEHRLQTRRLSSCGSRAQPLRGMWDLPRPGREPVSPALAGRFSTAAPPGKPGHIVFQHQPHGVGCITASISDWKKLKLSEEHPLAQGDPVGKWRSWNSHPVLGSSAIWYQVAQCLMPGA